MTIRLLLLCCTLGIISCQNQQEEVAELLSKVIDAHGGMQKWNVIQSVRYSKEYQLYNAQGDTTQHVIQYHAYHPADAYYEITSISKSDTTINVQNGDEYSRSINGIEQNVSQQNIQKSVETSTYVFGIPYNLWNDKEYISILPDIELNGISYKRILVDYQKGADNWHYLIDPNSYQIIANWYDGKDHKSLVINESFAELNGQLWFDERSSYRTDTLLNKKYLRAKYWYGDWEVK